MKNNKNGNPVPSLDKEDISVIINLLYEKHFHSAPRDKTYLNIISKLENGVETNKEQPEIHECEFNGDYMDARCIHCGKSMD